MSFLRDWRYYRSHGVNSLAFDMPFQEFGFDCVNKHMVHENYMAPCRRFDSLQNVVHFNGPGESGGTTRTIAVIKYDQ
jgi:hypothetical protein